MLEQFKKILNSNLEYQFIDKESYPRDANACIWEIYSEFICNNLNEIAKVYKIKNIKKLTLTNIIEALESTDLGLYVKSLIWIPKR